MLRVRPLVHTADPAAAGSFLRSLGLTPAQGPAAPGVPAVFYAGSGGVALRTCAPGSPEDGTTDLAFEVGDVEEFARRTADAGTPVELSGEDGPSARICAPDGTSFRAGSGPRATGAPASPLAVLALWHTTDVDAAVRVLEDIGARPRSSSDTATRYGFSAKNGGLVAVHRSGRTGVGLAFEYEGDVHDMAANLAANLTAGRFDPVAVDDGSLRIRAPWGAEVRVTEWRQGG